MTDKSGSTMREFLAGEAGGGALLMAAAAVALLLANGSAAVSHGYHALTHAVIGPTLSPALGPMTVHLWVNDGLMALFFLVVGLEIKRELVEGGLSSWERRRLPFVAAAAGMAVPALVYLLIARGNPVLASGWAIPAATDIAFALGILALLGRRVPASLRLFLTAVAIVDDMGAIAIIALVYSHGIDGGALVAAGGVLLAMVALNRRGVAALWPYALGFLLLWYCMMLSGVHATVAGVLAAMTVPMRAKGQRTTESEGPLHRMEHLLHPWSAYAIVPLFGFVNAGITLDASALGLAMTALPVGVAAGLFVGKQVGIFASMWLACRVGFAERPAGASWAQIYGLALLCGIGFTMSLFIGGLAFPHVPHLAEEAKIGILMGSVASAIAGYVVLRFAPSRAHSEAKAIAMSRN
ncbi:MAG: Na+/H+ antiporter NhaA [Sphingobium sp.]